MARADEPKRQQAEPQPVVLWFTRSGLPLAKKSCAKKEENTYTMGNSLAQGEGADMKFTKKTLGILAPENNVDANLKKG